METNNTVLCEKINNVSEEHLVKNINTQIINILNSNKYKIYINDIAKILGIKPIDIVLPNGRVIKQIKWEPKDLQKVFDIINKIREQSQIGKNDLIVIDGVCPTWLLPTISHAFHPTYTAITYPQGGENTILPLSGITIDKNGNGENIIFNVKEYDNFTIVEFNLTQPQIDVVSTLNTLIAPEIKIGKPVYITGRGPIAIATALAEAYAHKVPYIANFQPGIGYVISISHDLSHPIGTVINELNK